MNRRSFDVPPFSKYDRLVWKMCHFCYVRLPRPKPLDMEDLRAEAWLCYRKMAERYDPTRAKFITVFWWALRNHFGSILHKARRHQRVALTLDESGDDCSAEMVQARPDRTPPRLPEVFYGRLSREALLVARAFLEDGQAFTAWEASRYNRPGRGREKLRRAALFVGVDPQAIKAELAQALQPA